MHLIYFQKYLLIYRFDISLKKKYIVFIKSHWNFLNKEFLLKCPKNEIMIFNVFIKTISYNNEAINNENISFMFL